MNAILERGGIRRNAQLSALSEAVVQKLESHFQKWKAGKGHCMAVIGTGVLVGQVFGNIFISDAAFSTASSSVEDASTDYFEPPLTYGLEMIL